WSRIRGSSATPCAATSAPSPCHRSSGRPRSRSGASRGPVYGRGMLDDVGVVPSDYDSDPSRFGAWHAAHDVHEVVAARLLAEGLAPVLDLGCGRGRLRAELPAGAGWTGVDPSPAQLAEAPRPAACGP